MTGIDTIVIDTDSDTTSDYALLPHGKDMDHIEHPRLIVIERILKEIGIEIEIETGIGIGGSVTCLIKIARCATLGKYIQVVVGRVDAGGIRRTPITSIGDASTTIVSILRALIAIGAISSVTIWFRMASEFTITDTVKSRRTRIVHEVTRKIRLCHCD